MRKLESIAHAPFVDLGVRMPPSLVLNCSIPNSRTKERAAKVRAKLKPAK
jgi:hypothetical protein